MKIVHLSDLHIDRREAWDEGCRLNAWIADDIDARSEADGAPDLIVLAGDLFEAGSWPIERNEAATLLTRVTRRGPVLLLRGNHDRWGDLDLFAQLRTDHPVTVYDRPAIHRFAGGAVAVLPWLDRVRPVDTGRRRYTVAEEQAAEEQALRDLLDGLGRDLAACEGVRLFAGHCMIRDAKTSVGQPPRMTTEFVVSLDDLAHVPASAYLLGHVHLGQAWSIDGAPVVYNGSTRRTAFGEIETKRYTWVHIEDGRARLEHVPVPARPMVLVQSDWTGRFELDTEALVREAAGARVRLQYTVPAGEQDAARRDAEQLREALGAVGATLRAVPQVLASTRARAPGLATSRTLDAKLTAWLDATEREPDTADVAHARVLLGEIAGPLATGGCPAGGARLHRIRLQGFGVWREGVELDVDQLPGTVIAVLGENGHGKSTLLGAWPAAMHGEMPAPEKPYRTLDAFAGEDALLEVDVTVGGKPHQIQHHVSRKKVFVTGPDGIVDTGGGRKAFGVWAAENLLPQGVMMSCLFAPQGVNGLVVMRPGARRDTLLEGLRLEGLKALATTARARLAAAEKLGHEQRGRLGVLAERQRNLGAVDVGAARARLHAAEFARDQARVERDAGRAAWAADAEARRRREELGRDRAVATSGLVAIDRAIEEHARLLADADAIRAAVTADAALAAQEQDTRLVEAAARARADAAQERAAREQTRRQEAERRADEAFKTYSAAGDAELGEPVPREGTWTREASWEAVVLRREAEYRAAETALPVLRDAVDAAERALGAAERARDLAAAKALQGVIGRVLTLRGTLVDVEAAETLAAAHGVARSAREEDERLDAPDTGDDLARACDAAAHALLMARERLAAAELLAAKLPEMLRARAVRIEAKARIDAEFGTIEEAKKAWVAADDEADLADVTVASAARTLAALAEVRAGHASRLAAAPALARAEGQGAVLQTQREIAQARVVALEAALRADVPAPVVDLDALDGVLARADAEVRMADLALAAAEDRAAEGERIAADRIAATERLDAAERDRRAWVLLEEALGPTGIPLLEVDAIGPEMTAAANDLLHACHGPRFTIEIDTQRLGAKEQTLDEVMIWVTDTETPPPYRRDDARHYSPGEQFPLGLAVSLAFAQVVCSRAGVEAPTLVRDEALAGVSPGNRAAAMAMLRRAALAVNASKVFLVTHDRELAEMADTAIVVDQGAYTVMSPVRFG